MVAPDLTDAAMLLAMVLTSFEVPGGIRALAPTFFYYDDDIGLGGER